MSESTGKIFEFDDYRLIPDEGLLLRDGEEVQLSPKAFAMLLMLVERHGHLVKKNDILDRVWGDTFVEEGVIPNVFRPFEMPWENPKAPTLHPD
jgi:DNA-binding winged helix-turn-helix (wHTH) protein